jgi:hypothetical protein
MHACSDATDGRSIRCKLHIYLCPCLMAAWRSHLPHSDSHCLALSRAPGSIDHSECCLIRANARHSTRGWHELQLLFTD